MSDAPREVKPWDMLNKNMERALPAIAQNRLNTCKGCERFIKLTHQCRECGCIMNAKVKLQDATCPLNKWVTPDLPFDRELTEDDLTKIIEG
jgi:hypothetical protein